MNRLGKEYPSALLRVRRELVVRLRERAPEIEDAILARIRTLPDFAGEDDPGDPDYSAGLRAAVAEVVDYALICIELGEDAAETIPSAAAAQARRAARHDISLDTVLRRYAAGDRLLGEFIMAEADDFPAQALQKIQQAQGAQIDHLMAAVGAEYRDEVAKLKRSPTQRLSERVQRVLAGNATVETADLDYELGAWNLGVILAGAQAKEATRSLAGQLSAQLLAVPRGSGIVWAWIGSHRRLGVEDVEACLPGIHPEVSLAIGEPRRGIDGWRLSHQEAQAAFEVMLRRPRRVTRGSEVLMLAAVLRDEALAKSLIETYLTPLDERGDNGRVLRETLRAYFAAGLNAQTAAAALSVDRHTVQRRLRKVEELLGRQLNSCHAELEVALSLEELDSVVMPEGMLAVG